MFKARVLGLREPLILDNILYQPSIGFSRVGNSIEESDAGSMFVAAGLALPRPTTPHNKKRTVLSRQTSAQPRPGKCPNLLPVV